MLHGSSRNSYPAKKMVPKSTVVGSNAGQKKTISRRHNKKTRVAAKKLIRDGEEK
jgi:hypothetical protein